MRLVLTLTLLMTPAQEPAASAPPDFVSLYEKARHTYNDGPDTVANYRTAEEQFDAALAAATENEDKARAHAWKGMNYLRIGDLQSSVDAKLPFYKMGEAEAKNGIALNARCADCHWAASSCLGRWGEQRGILKSLFVARDVIGGFKKALEISPQHLEARMAMGKVDEALPSFAGGSAERAEATFRGVLEDHPRFTRAMLDLADLLEREGEDEEARTWVERVLNEERPMLSGEHRKWDLPRAKKLLERLAD